MATTDEVNPGSTESSHADHGVFDINRFNRTPEGRWHANRGTARQTPGNYSHESAVDAARRDAYMQFEQSTAPEHQTISPEAMKQLIDRAIQTAQLLEMYRRDKSGDMN